MIFVGEKKKREDGMLVEIGVRCPTMIHAKP